MSLPLVASGGDLHSLACDPFLNFLLLPFSTSCFHQHTPLPLTSCFPLTRSSVIVSCPPRWSGITAL